VLVLRAFTVMADNGGVTLAGAVRNACAWCSGTFEHWIKVSDLLTAAQELRLSYLER
jgi:hypothetical protein